MILCATFQLSIDVPTSIPWALHGTHMGCIRVPYSEYGPVWATYEHAGERLHVGIHIHIVGLYITNTLYRRDTLICTANNPYCVTIQCISTCGDNKLPTYRHYLPNMPRGAHKEPIFSYETHIKTTQISPNARENCWQDSEHIHNSFY